MEQLISHIFGDYVLQNSWMANNKEKSTFPCIVHCLVYALCFSTLTSYYGVILIFISHFIVDRTGIAKKYALLNVDSNAPDYVKFYVSVAVDNGIHLLQNFMIISSLK